MTAPQNAQEAIREAAQHIESWDRFSAFAYTFWSEAVPSAPLVWGRHMRAVCDEIQEVLEEGDRRRKRAHEIIAAYPHGKEHLAAVQLEEELGSLPKLRLVILVPPRNSKSAIVSRMLPGWRWSHRPQDQFLTLSAADTLIERDGLHLRDLVKSDTYQRYLARAVKDGKLPESFDLRPDQYAKGKFENTAGGTRSGHPLGGAYTGVDADVIVIDDPHDIDDAFGGTPEQQNRSMAEVQETYRTKIQDRLNSQIWGVIILIMQPVHVSDLSTYMIREGARVVCLPAEYDPTHPHVYDKDWRKFPGEPLNPLRQPASVLRAIRASQGEHAYATKYLMRPTPKEGGRYRRAWFDEHRYDEDPHDLAGRLAEVVITVDTARKTGPDNDFTSMQVWGRLGADRYLLDRKSGRWRFAALKEEFRALCRAWPEAVAKWVEDADNGPALKDDLEREIPGIVLVPTQGLAKTARSVYAENAAEAGNVWVPRIAPWVDAFITSVCAFGAGGAHDDDVDGMSLPLMRWAQGLVPWLSQERRAAIGKVRPSVVVGDHARRWERHDPEESYWMGIVPGWATGGFGDEAIAVVVGRRGRIAAIVEVTSGGIDAFVSAVYQEAQHWRVQSVRYAERAEGPAPQITRALAKKRVRFVPRPGKTAGQPGGGWAGSKPEVAELWTMFLRRMAEGLATIQDEATMALLAGVVEENGQPHYAGGQPIGGRLLAYLLALAGAAAAVRPAKKDGPTFTIQKPKLVGVWG